MPFDPYESLPHTVGKPFDPYESVPHTVGKPFDPSKTVAHTVGEPFDPSETVAHTVGEPFDPSKTVAHTVGEQITMEFHYICARKNISMNKLELLKQKIASYERLAVAYSGGVDSTFLLKVVQDVLGDKVMAFLIDSPVLARRDEKEAVAWLGQIGMKYEIIEGNPFGVEEFVENTQLRCYFCKRTYFTDIVNNARSLGFDHVADGQNADDALATDRPGARAAHELGVVSPLNDCGLTKEDIRHFSRQLGLPVWDKPSNACLATRIPFHTRITAERLHRVEAAEEVLRSRRLEGCRVRCHDELARIEAPQAYFDVIRGDEQIVGELKALGFKYITLDLEGFRSGSMN